ncbi:hypothetical protein A0J61_11242, partial [Choanephora cucurbitarum]
MKDISEFDLDDDEVVHNAYGQHVRSGK